MNFGFSTLLALGCLILLSAGCVSTPKDDLIFGLPGEDKIVSRYEKPYDQVKAAAITVLKRSGTLVGDDLVRTVLEAAIDSAKALVVLDDSEPKITKATGLVDRTEIAHIDLASEMPKQ